jgi:hypothetical protein
MKKRHLHTRFINFLIEKNSHDEEIESEELLDKEEPEETIETPEDEYIDDDEVIDKLLTEYRKTKAKYENIRNKK